MSDTVIRIIFAAILGGVLGSFANVLIIRWHESASILGRSHCPGCKKAIKPRHLLPVLSWVLLRGKCAYCGKKIHFQYPLVEAACLLLAVVAAMRHDPFHAASAPFFVFELILSIGLVVPVVMDWRWKEIPVEYLAGLGAFLWSFRLINQVALSGWDGVSVSWLAFDVSAVAGGALFFAVQFLLSKGRWIGSGDIWMGAFMGAVLGWPNIAVGIYLAYIIGGIAVVVGLLSGKLQRRSKVPFGPALGLGAWLAHWYGAIIMMWLYGQ